MRHLNYNHLKYFHEVAHQGSVKKAAETLHLTPQTISGQLRQLEDTIGQPLFDRVGRRLLISEMGHLVLEYADEIFAIGTELSQVVRGQVNVGPSMMSIGIVNSMPKLIAQRIIEPSLGTDNPIRIRCHEASLEQLLSELSVHKIDLVLSDQPMPAGLRLKAYNHQLGESGLSFFCQKKLARRYKAQFPQSLNQAPMLLPSRHSALRRRLDEWFDQQDLAPEIIGEFDDSALMKAFGQSGSGLYVAPTAIENEVCAMYGATCVGRTSEIVEQFYAISPERRIKHPSVAHILEAARHELFIDPKAPDETS